MSISTKEETGKSSSRGLIPDLEDLVFSFLIRPDEVSMLKKFGDLCIQYPQYARLKEEHANMMIELENQMSGYLECGFIESLEDEDAERSSYYFEALYDNTVARYRREGREIDLGVEWIVES